MTDYRTKYNKAENQRKIAWRKYYGILEESYNLYDEIYTHFQGQCQPEDVSEGLTPHLQAFIQKLYKQAKDHIECPICMDVIDYKDLDTQNCGHNFHKECFKQLCETEDHQHERYVNCPMCRQKLWNKHRK